MDKVLAWKGTSKPDLEVGAEPIKIVTVSNDCTWCEEIECLANRLNLLLHVNPYKTLKNVHTKILNGNIPLIWLNDSK